jgi:isopentenyldiphosphate isomerase
VKRATTDPEERLEVFDADGRPTGIAKTRAAIHHDGDWHLAFFCWIVRTNGSHIDILLQRRAPTKDVWPRRFDASAAGHVRFGETTAEASREIEEELGLDVAPSQLEAVMRHHQEHVHESGLVDREIHDVHLLRCDLPLEDYRPGPEVTGIASVSLDALVELVEHMRDAIATSLVTFGTGGHARHEAFVLHRDDLVPYDGTYWRALARAAGVRRA